MQAAVQYGTARSLRANFNQFPVLGKTGTCSNNGTRFGWFASYANTPQGRIVTVFFLEGGRPTFGPKAAELTGEFYRALWDKNYFAGKPSLIRRPANPALHASAVCKPAGQRRWRETSRSDSRAARAPYSRSSKASAGAKPNKRHNRKMKVLTAAEMAATDQRTAQGGVPLATLMENAGGAVARFVLRQYPQAQRVLVVCGKGNNGGDGSVVARLLASAGKSVTVLLLAEASTLQGDASAMFAALQGTAGGDS